MSIGNPAPQPALLQQKQAATASEAEEAAEVAERRLSEPRADWEAEFDRLCELGDMAHDADR